MRAVLRAPSEERAHQRGDAAARDEISREDRPHNEESCENRSVADSTPRQGMHNNSTESHEPSKESNDSLLPMEWSETEDAERVREDEAKCGDDHAMDDQDVIDPAIKHHDVSQEHGEESERTIGAQPSYNQCGRKPTCEDNHAMGDQDVIDPAIEFHDVCHDHRGRMEQVEVGMSSFQEREQGGSTTGVPKEAPWMAPRVIMKWIDEMWRQ